jgi:hypothetical protein
MAKGVQETLRRDLEKIKRLDELLSRPIFSTRHIARLITQAWTDRELPQSLAESKFKE